MNAVLYGPNGLPLTPQSPVLVDPTHQALRASSFPQERQFAGGLILGHYRFGRVISSQSAAASPNAMIVFRWGDTRQRLCALLKFQLGYTQAAVSLAPTTDVIVARLQTVRQMTATAGGTTVTPIPARSALMPPSLVTEFRVATAVSPATFTGTFDGVAFAVSAIRLGSPGGTTTVGGGVRLIDFYAPDIASGEHPVVFGQDEGFAFTVTTNDTNQKFYYVVMNWVEFFVDQRGF